MLTFEHVRKFIFSDFSLHVSKGIVVGVIGPSGAGKTTLLRLAGGLLKPEEGEVYTLQKNPVEQRNALGVHMGCLLERLLIFDEQASVWDNMQNLRIIHRMTDAAFQIEYVELSQKFGIQEFQHSAVQDLSLGQRRRAELVAILLHRPELLLLDEPTNGLDENAKQVLQEILRSRVKEGMTVVMASHNMREISDVCDRIVLLDQGQLLYYGEENLLLRKYAPMDRMRLKLSGALPDMDDLPITEYIIEGEELRLTYNSNHISSSKILEELLKQTSVSEVSIQKADLAEVIFAIKEGKK